MQARAQKVNLRVTAISPGMVETEFYQVSHFNDKNKIASTPYQNMKCLQAEDIAQVLPVSLATFRLWAAHGCLNLRRGHLCLMSSPFVCPPCPHEHSNGG